MKITVEKVEGYEIYHLIFENKQSLTKTMLRFEEHYESPNEEFRSRPFTLGEFRKWYIKETKNDMFTYYTDWAGFNIPSYIFDTFLNGDFDPLEKAEKQIVEIVKDIKTHTDKFYIIATYKNGHASTIEHEILHGIFYLDSSYRKKVLNRLAKYDTSALRKMLLSVGYCEPVLDDECNAYLATKNDDYLEYKKVEYPAKLRKELIALKENYYKG